MSNIGVLWKDPVETTKMPGGIRHRNLKSPEYNSREAPKHGEDVGFARSIMKFDVYAKVDDDLQVKTETGAVVTIAFWILMALLACGEVAAYLRKAPPTERLVVDSTMGQKLRINADITFHSIPCLDVHVDAMDVAGENQLDINHDILKQRLDPDGKAIGDPFTEVPGEGDKSLEVPPDYCGSCYGATSKQCCNSCKDVTDAYASAGWTLHDIRRTAEQCIRDHHIQAPIVEGEGCRLTGFMEVNKVSGNFHVAAGEGVMRDGRHVHQYNLEEAEAFNASHTIHSLSFGKEYPGMRPNPLDATSKIIDEARSVFHDTDVATENREREAFRKNIADALTVKDVGTGLFQYFIKLVPTVHAVDPPLYGSRWGAARLERAIDAVVSSQFAYTFKFRSMKGHTQYHREHEARIPDHHAAHGEDEDEAAKDSKDSGSANYNILPGIFFVYDVSPFMVEVIPATRLPFSHLVTRLCAVAGGALAVSRIVDAAVHHVATRRLKGLLGR